MSDNRGQVSMAMGSGLLVVLFAVFAIIATASFTGHISQEAAENEINPIARDVAMSASSNALIPLALIIGAVIVCAIFIFTSIRAFGGKG